MLEKFKEIYMKNFKLPEENDEFRPIYANNDEGGFVFSSKKTIEMIRSIAIDLIMKIGRKILGGDFDLTTVSVPIKVMIPLTIFIIICYIL